MSSKTNPTILLTVLVLMAAIVCPTAAAKTIYVDADATGANNGSSWDDAYNCLQDALADANSSTKPVEIWVAQGTYKPDQGGDQTPGDRIATFQFINDVAIYGGFPSGGGTWNDRDPNDPNNKTILTGDLGDNDVPVTDPCDLLDEPTRAENSYHVVTGSGTDANAVLDGFYIIAGNANSSPYPHYYGAGMINLEGDPNIVNCIFTGNSAIYGGGMYNRGSNPHLADCAFVGNAAGELGGGIFNWGSSSALVWCDFSGNAAARGGGMLNYDNSSPSITNCSFENNRASDYGGAMENYENCNAVVTGCSFANNTADQGGGMVNYKSNPELTDCDFIGNQANYGGGMDNWGGSSPLIADCAFVRNAAGEDGGGIYNDSSSPELRNCMFIANRASYGAGMSNRSGSSPVLRKCHFIENATWYNPEYCDGAGIYSNSSSLELYDCTFERNVATVPNYSGINRQGGAIRNYDSHVVLNNCKFVENLADLSGGAISSDGNSSVTATNCEFVRNSSYRGGAIDSFGTTALNLTNCTFAANTAGLGDAIYDTGNPVLANCILRGNSDSSGIDETDLLCTEGGTPIVNYSCIQGWTGSLGGVGNIGDNPMFVREPDSGGDGWGDNAATINIDEGANDDYGTLHLLPSSPCIDAGDNTAVPPDTNDLDSDGDTTEPIPWDLDGDTRFTDEPNVPDTGSGTPPIVDMGAYEGPKQGFLLSMELLEISEGQTVTFTVSLRLNPLGTFEADVFIESGDTDITVQSGGSLVFNSSNYTVPQTVRLYAAEDPDWFDALAVIAVAAPGIVTSRVNVLERDNEPNVNTVYVDADAPGANDGSSWENAYTALQDALDKAVIVGRLINHIRFTDFEIWVAGGVYKPAPAFSGDRAVSFTLMRHLVIKGGYAGFGEPEPDARNVKLHETILSGDLDGDDVGDLYDPSRNENSYHVVTGSYTDETTLLEGFTITAGNANHIHGYYGGGGLNNYKGHLTVDNCKFIGNSATSAFDGGGGAVHNRLSNPTITNCSFNGNRATGSGSEVGGGAIYNHESTPTISGCVFTGNVAGRGGSIYNNKSNAMISNCTFIANTAASTGGGVLNERGCTTTIANSVSHYGGGMFEGTSSNSTVTNCIFWGNTAPSGLQMYGSVIVTYSDVQGGWPGDGNIDADPRFVDPSVEDYHLLPNSPCIDAGDNSELNLGATDLDGHPRIIDGDCNDTKVVDMGAYEFNYAYIGDFDYNCSVDFFDFSIFALTWFTEPADEQWNPFCNIGIPADSYIDWRDVAILCGNWLAGVEP